MRQFSVYVIETREGWSTVEAETALESARRAAKEAGATFDPEPIEPVEIWRSLEIPARRLMFRPNAQETPKVPGVEFDGWRQTNRPSGTYRWESKGLMGDWGWCGNDILMAELARRLLAEWSRPVKGLAVSSCARDWVDVAWLEWNYDGDPRSDWADAVRKHAPRVEDVVERLRAVAGGGWLKNHFELVEEACLAAGLKRGGEA